MGAAERNEAISTPSRRIAQAVANELESWSDGLKAGDFESTHELSEPEAKQAMLLLHFLVERAIAETRRLR